MKKWIAIGLTMAMLSTAALPAMAASEAAQLRPDYTIMIDGAEKVFVTANGTVTYPILFEGNTYLPLRAIGELMGKNVNWDETTKTVTISGTRQTPTATQNQRMGEILDVSVEERKDFTIVIDGVKKEFKAASGTKLYPVLYNGSTYLPLRAIGEIMGKEVAWNSTTKTVSLTAKDGGTVTDADSFTTTPSNGNAANQPANQGTDIGVEKAKQIALKDASVNEKDVYLVKAEKDKDDGRVTYEIEFYYNNTEYDYEIDAVTGAILSFDKDIEDYTPNQNQTTTAITLEKAKEIALADAGLKAGNVRFIKAESDDDDGQKKYDIEFYSGNTKYEYEISATTGKVLEFDKDND